MDYFSFYPTVWNFIPYPEGTLSWSHMWFVVYLFCFILLLTPLFAVFKLKWLADNKERISHFLSYPASTIILVVPLMVIYYFFYLSYPIQGSLLDDWFLFSFSITFLLYGFFLGGSETFWMNCARYRNHYLLTAAVAVILLFLNYWWPLHVPKENGQRFSIYIVLNCIEIWATLLAICGYAKKYLHRGSHALNYLNKAVYPYYIIHQTIIVFLGYYIVRWDMHFMLKFFILTSLSLLLILSVYHFIIRKTRLTRFLFGVKG
jgi:peptidoglycan/LPS O-acetylase OafA/YrhL